MSNRMAKVIVTATLALLALVACPAPAWADLTAFWGFTPTRETRAVKGFAIGAAAAVVGAEFEWARTDEDTANNAPGLKTYMFDGQILTPGRRTQVYFTFGWGRYNERLGTAEQTGSATDIGGGVKSRIAGPIKLRVDYRLFTLRGTPVIKNPKRFYAGVAIGF